MTPSAIALGEGEREGEMVNGVLNRVEDGMELELGDMDAQVLVVGAGPAGLMLGMNLARFGVEVKIVDDRQDKTSTGRADGLQPKTIETFRQLRLEEVLLRKGVKVFDICFWNSTPTEKLARQSREVHYPPAAVPTLDPYVLLVHQGMIEDVFLADLQSRGVEVTRSAPFVLAQQSLKGGLISSTCGKGLLFKSQHVIGCDGAHSMVRKSMSGVEMCGESGKAAWGVIDGVLRTNFPDIWSKTAIHSSEHGAVLCIPRERNMTRLYIELHSAGEPENKQELGQEFVMNKARAIMAPFSVEWESVEWFSIYRVGQRLASSFASPSQQIIITGDAAHTHSPKAAQGMNVSMHDSLNLAWKLALTVRGLATSALLPTYELERRQIAQQLLDFDFEHANAFHDGDAEKLAENFANNIHFISGVGADYAFNVLNWAQMGGKQIGKSGARAGALVPIAKATRFIDANPVHLQLDIPMLCQFRVYFIVHYMKSSMSLLREMCDYIASEKSVLGRASRAAGKSFETTPSRLTEEEVQYGQLERYTRVSKLFTPAILFGGDKWDVEIEMLPALLRGSPWTVYHDDLGAGKKWIGGVEEMEVVVVNVRPDGYVGSVGRWDVGQGQEAKKWLDGYYGGVLRG